MSWLPLSFGFPAILWGLLALPVIWWLLRLTPPKPQTEIFPPLKILARVLKKEETPHQSPWWLTLLRLMMAALIVIGACRADLEPAREIADRRTKRLRWSSTMAGPAHRTGIAASPRPKG